MIRKQRDLETETVTRPQGTLILQSMTRDGLITRRRKYPMHSMTRNYWRIMASPDGGLGATGGLFFGAATVIRGNGSTVGAPTTTAIGFSHRAVAAAGQIWGVQVGTGATPMSLLDLGLDARVPHGMSAGELNYLESFATATDLSLTAVRAFENLSGDTININEIALSAYRSGDGASQSHPYNYARDVLPETFPLPNGEVATATITISVSEGTRNMHRMFHPMTLSAGNWQNTFYNRGGTTNIDYANRRTAKAPAGNDYGGILLGTGDTEKGFTDIDLAERIPQGDAVGQLLYGATTDNITATQSSTEMSFQLQRTVMNDSPEPITVREMGLFAYNGTISYLLDRFILTTPIELAPAENRQVRWLFRYTTA